MAELKFQNITEKIIGASFEVHKFLGNGFQEVIYQRASAWELNQAKLNYVREIEQEIFYKELQEPIGTRRADFVVENTIIVELKAIINLENVHLAQAKNYVVAYDFPIGFKELEGIHSRTDFDLQQHQKFSGKKLQYFDNDLDEATGKPFGNYVPYVVETSIGLDRAFLMVVSAAYEVEDLSTEEKKDDRVVMHLPAFLAPTKLAILPLTKKDGLQELAQELMHGLGDHRPPPNHRRAWRLQEAHRDDFDAVLLDGY